MKTRPAILVLLTILCGCQGANEVTGPAAFFKRTPTVTIPDARVRPVVVPHARGGAVAPTRPYVTPTPRLYPCLVDPGDIERKNEPCRPCDDVTIAPGFEPKNKPCHVYSPTPTPRAPREPTNPQGP
jgi:hypothetical protein